MQKAIFFLLIIITTTPALFSQNASLQLFGDLHKSLVNQIVVAYR